VAVNRWRQNEGAMLAAFEKHSSQSIVTRLPNDYRQRNEALTLGLLLTGSWNKLLLSRPVAAWILSENASSGRTSSPADEVAVSDQ
jgi:hypothetical protein